MSNTLSVRKEPSYIKNNFPRLWKPPCDRGGESAGSTDGKGVKVQAQLVILHVKRESDICRKPIFAIKSKFLYLANIITTWTNINLKGKQIIHIEKSTDRSLQSIY